MQNRQFKFSTITNSDQTIGFSEYNQQYNSLSLKVVGATQLDQSTFTINPYSGFTFNNSVKILNTLSVNDLVINGSQLPPVALNGSYNSLYNLPDLTIYGKLNTLGQIWNGSQTFSNGARSLSQPTSDFDLITKGYADSTYVPSPASYNNLGSVTISPNLGLNLANGYLSLNYDPSTLLINNLGQLSSKIPTNYVQDITSFNDTLFISESNNLYNIDINTGSSLNWTNPQTFSSGLTSNGVTTISTLIVKNPYTSNFQELSAVAFSNNYQDLFQKPDLSVYVKPTVSNIWYQTQGFTGGATITGIPTPSSSTDVSNKNYVDYSPLIIADNITTSPNLSNSGNPIGNKLVSLYEQYRTSVSLLSTTWALGNELIIASYPIPAVNSNPTGSFVTLKYSMYGLFTLVLSCNLKTLTIESITPLNLGTISPSNFLNSFNLKLYTYSKTSGGQQCYVLTLTPKLNLSSLEFTYMYLTSNGNYVFKPTLPMTGDFFGYPKSGISGIFSQVPNTVINYINTTSSNQTTIEDLQNEINQLKAQILNIESQL